MVCISMPAGAQENRGITYGPVLLENIQFNDIQNHWAQQSIGKMTAFSIVRGYGDGNFHPEASVSRQEALAFLIRLMGLEDLAQLKAESEVSGSAGAWDNPMDFWARGYYLVAVEKGMITKDEMDSMDWTLPAQRQEVAVWTAKALKTQPQYGAQPMIDQFSDFKQFNPLYIPYIEPILLQEIMVGQTAQSFAPQATIKRGEMITILDRISNHFVGEHGITRHMGTVTGQRLGLEKQDDMDISHTIWEIQDPSGELNDLVIRKGKKGIKEMVLNDMIICKEGKFSLSNSLSIGDEIVYFLNNEQSVFYASVTGHQEEILEGTLEVTDGNKIIISDVSGQMISAEILPEVEIVVNLHPGKRSDLHYGQHVIIYLANGKVYKIMSTLNNEDIQGYIPLESRQYYGKVLSLEQDELMIKQSQGQEATYYVDAQTRVLKGKQPGSLSQIKLGDWVKISFADKDTDWVDVIEVQGPEMMISHIYKGYLARTYYPNSECLLEDVMVLNNTKWDSGSAQMELEMAKDVKAYDGGRLIKAAGMGNFIGQEVYAVTVSHFGQEKVVQLLFKQGYEKKYNDMLEEVDWMNENLRLNDKNIHYSEGSILVKDGRLIHPYNLMEDEQVFVIANKGDEVQQAAIVSIQTEEMSEWKILRGRIEQVYDDRLILNNDEDLAFIEEQDWKHEKSDEPLFINDETRIIDSENEIVKPQLFLDRGETYYSGQKIYLVTDKDEILGLVMMSKEFSTNARITVGKIIKPVTNGMIEIEQAKDWSSFTGKWQMSSSMSTVNIDKALIIKDKRARTADDLAAGDELYILREGADGLIVIVQ